MRLQRLRRKPNDDDRILPLINVVFLLLIFFMVVGRLSGSDPFEIAPPVSASDGDATGREMTILVAADGRLALDDAVMDEAALQAEVAARIAAGGAGPVRLKADGDAEAVAVVGVMEMLRAAGVERLKLLTVPEGP